MIQHDPDVVTLQLRIGRRGGRLVRNAIMGAAVFAVLFNIVASTYRYGAGSFLFPLLAGAVFAVLGTAGALLGQVVAGPEEATASPIYWRAVWYAGLITGDFAAIGVVMIMLASGEPYSGLLFGLFALAFGGTLGAMATLAVRLAAKVLSRGGTPAETLAPKLGEGQFQPLGTRANHVEEPARR